MNRRPTWHIDPKAIGIGILLLTTVFTAKAQYGFLSQAPPAERIKVLWRYCSYNFISDWPPDSTARFLAGAKQVADSLGDQSLQAYIHYFSTCSQILFANSYEDHFAKGDHLTVVRAFSRARDEATEAGNEDIVASAEHYIGQVYFRAALFGQAFEHLLKADVMMQRLGYQNIPAVSIYLYDLGLDYYKFEDFDKALPCFLEGVKYPMYLPRVELSSLNAIGLIYAKKGNLEKAIDYYHRTIDGATAVKDTAWIGIASGNLGSVFLENGDNEQAIKYYRINYVVNQKTRAAGNDAALSSLYMAKAFTRLNKMDSADKYLHEALKLGLQPMADKTERLHFYKTYLEAGIEASKKTGNLQRALLLSDSLLMLKDSARTLLDSKILNRAVQKTEAEKNLAELQLLESRKNLRQLGLLSIITVLAIAIVVILLFFKRYKAQKAAQEALAEKERQLLSIEKLRAEDNLKHAGTQLETYLATIREKNEYIQLLTTQMDGLKEDRGNGETPNPYSPVVETLLSRTILTDDDWRHFRGLFEQVYPGFTEQLAGKLPHLSPAETRLLILSRLNLSPREMANMLGVSVDAIRKSRYRLRKKLELPEDAEFYSIVKDL